MEKLPFELSHMVYVRLGVAQSVIENVRQRVRLTGRITAQEVAALRGDVETLLDGLVYELAAYEKRRA